MHRSEDSRLRRGRALGAALLSIVAGFVACDEAGTVVVGPPPTIPPADLCTQSALADVRSFPVCGAGAGVFGRWIVDARGMPAYAYDAAQESDARCAYPNTLHDDRRTHWAPIGNDRVHGLAFNDGYVELFGQERGAAFYDAFEPDQGNYAGGFGWVAPSDGPARRTRTRTAPPAPTSRASSAGILSETSTESSGGVRATRAVYAPPGDAPLLLSDVTIESTDGVARDVRWTEYWDVDRQPLTFELLRTGRFGVSGDETRDAENAHFTQSTTFDGSTLRAHMDWALPSPRTPHDQVSATDDWPADVFLAALTGPVATAYTDQARFFGQGGPKLPDAVAAADLARP